MQDLTKSDWEKFIQHAAVQWQMPPEAAVFNMVSVIRHAIYDPALALVISTTGLLKMTEEPQPLTAAWIDDCQQAAREWLVNYRQNEHNCDQKTQDQSQTCLCILNQIGPLFSNSAALHERGLHLMAQLPEADRDEAYDMLLRALRRLARIAEELEQGQIDWLREYVDSKTY